MKIHNNMCDGAHCRDELGEVRVYPIGGDGNMIYCRACWDYENRYRAERVQEGNVDPENFPQLDWNTAKVYDPGEIWITNIFEWPK